MSALSKVPFLGGYQEQSMLNDARSQNTVAQFMQMLSLVESQRRAAEARSQQALMNQFAGQLSPEDQLEFRLDPKGYLAGKRSKQEIETYMQGMQQAQPTAPVQKLTGFEPIPNGVPGQRGMVGDVGQLVQDVVRREDLPMKEKQAIIGQILAQQRSGTPQAATMPPAGMFSTNPIIREAAKFHQTQQDKKEAAEQNRVFQETVLEEGRNARAAMAASAKAASPEAFLERERLKALAAKAKTEMLAKIPGTPEHARVEAAKVRELKRREAATATQRYAESTVEMLKTSLSDILGVPPEQLEQAFAPENLKKLYKRVAPVVGTIDSSLPTMLQSSRDVESPIENLKNKAQMFGLTALRQANVAPGSITEKEWPKFESTLANIDISLGEKAFIKQMRDIWQLTKERQNVGALDAQRALEGVYDNALFGPGMPVGTPGTETSNEWQDM